MDLKFISIKSDYLIWVPPNLKPDLNLTSLDPKLDLITKSDPKYLNNEKPTTGFVEAKFKQLVWLILLLDLDSPHQISMFFDDISTELKVLNHYYYFVGAPVSLDSDEKDNVGQIFRENGLVGWLVHRIKGFKVILVWFFQSQADGIVFDGDFGSSQVKTRQRSAYFSQFSFVDFRSRSLFPSLLIHSLF